MAIRICKQEFEGLAVNKAYFVAAHHAQLIRRSLGSSQTVLPFRDLYLSLVRSCCRCPLPKFIDLPRVLLNHMHTHAAVVFDPLSGRGLVSHSLHAWDALLNRANKLQTPHGFEFNRVPWATPWESPAPALEM